MIKFVVMSILLFYSSLTFSKPTFVEKVVRLTQSQQLEVEQLATGFSTPWGLAFLQDHLILVSERPGELYLIDLNASTITRTQHPADILTGGQGGLLDVAQGPQHLWTYFTYSKASKASKGQAVTVLARAKIKDLRWVDWQELLVTNARSNNGRHFGSRITFDDQGHLFFSVGDRGERSNGQDLSTHAGKILRLKLDGTVPNDNPFYRIKSAKPEIWSLGHRNPQGLFYDRKTAKLWSIEHGPRGGDEINLIEKGGNYGWPIVSHGKEYWGPVAVGEATSKQGMIDPIKVYIPSIAPSSLMLYRGDAFPNWKGDLFAGSLKLTHLNRIEIDGRGRATEEERLLESMGERVRDVVEGPEGWIYFSTDHGNVYRLRPVR